MPRQAKGNWAKGNIEVIRLAEEMQALAVQHIEEQFKADELTSPDPMRFDDFVKMLEEADRTGRRDELEALLAQMLMPAIQEVMAKSQQSSQPAAPPAGG